MKITGTIAAILMLAGFPAAAQPLPATFVRPGWSAYVEPKATDHMATMMVKEPGRPQKQVTIRRHGALQREDISENGHDYSVFVDLDAGLSWRLARQRDGSPFDLSILGETENDRKVLRKTPGTDRVLNETCIVWDMAGPERKAYDGKHTECITDDGILLWQKVFYADGSLMSEARATSITRRRVAPAEVALPRDALKLSAYGDWTPGSTARHNDEVLLTYGTTAQLRVRRLGVLTMTSDSTGGTLSTTYTNATYSLSVQETADGALYRLDLSLRPTPPADWPPSGEHTTAVTVLGLRCQLYNMTPGVQDYGETQCRTSDGMLLEKAVQTRAGGRVYTATQVKRGSMKITDVTPPADILIHPRKSHRP